jgi:hypothetical protein
MTRPEIGAYRASELYRTGEAAAQHPNAVINKWKGQDPTAPVEIGAATLAVAVAGVQERTLSRSTASTMSG